MATCTPTPSQAGRVLGRISAQNRRKVSNAARTLALQNDRKRKAKRRQSMQRFANKKSKTPTQIRLL